MSHEPKAKSQTVEPQYTYNSIVGYCLISWFITYLSSIKFRTSTNFREILEMTLTRNAIGLNEKDWSHNLK
tara:strand:+ start:130 stop:342 length:213 start_codon:yes stop_codon:yes gene_type:complete